MWEQACVEVQVMQKSDPYAICGNCGMAASPMNATFLFDEESGEKIWLHVDCNYPDGVFSESDEA